MASARCRGCRRRTAGAVARRSQDALAGRARLMDPIILFFLLGLIAGLLKSELRLPSAVYEFVSILLLLSIGLKGGVELARQLDAALEPDREQQQDADEFVHRRRQPELGLQQPGDQAEQEKQDDRIHQSRSTRQRNFWPARSGTSGSRSVPQTSGTCHSARLSVIVPRFAGSR